MTGTVILSDRDFTDARPTNLSLCRLVILHANLFGVTPAAGDKHSKARDLLKMALEVAQDFPEMRVGLLNCLDYPELAERQSVYVSEFGTQCAVVIFIEARAPHVISAAHNETPESFHHWMQGILAAWGYRHTVTREEIVVRLAYDIAQPPEATCPNSRWDDSQIRAQAIHATRRALWPLYEAWLPGLEVGFE